VSDTASTPKSAPTTTTRTRAIAIEALVRIDDGAYAHILLPELLRRQGLEPRDRAFVTELVYGTIRMRRALDFLLGRFSKRKLDTLDPDVRAGLRVGAFQLFTGVSPHAAVGETVGAVQERARGFTNGVLRALARSGPDYSLPQGDDAGSIGIRTSHPDWIVQQLIDDLGRDDALATLALDNEPPVVTLRVNRMRATVDDITAELRALDIDVEPGTLDPTALLVRHTGDLGALAALREGRVTPQDQASQAIVAALDPQPGERLLDVAAAPGGKATAAAERMNDDGVVVAADLHAARVRTIMRTAHRCGLRAVVPAVADGRQLPVRDASFDRVLLDAPCTGLGVLRRRPDARWRVQPRDATALAELQRALLVQAARAVRPGGRLVYSVCTLTRIETTGIDAFAASELPDFVVPDELLFGGGAAPWRKHGRGALLVPSAARTDGMFVLVLERSR
jgi:16S rRNA (cytosine967-C5)-methyltransferase